MYVNDKYFSSYYLLVTGCYKYCSPAWGFFSLQNRFYLQNSTKSVLANVCYYFCKYSVI